MSSDNLRDQQEARMCLMFSLSFFAALNVFNTTTFDGARNSLAHLQVRAFIEIHAYES